MTEKPLHPGQNTIRLVLDLKDVPCDVAFDRDAEGNITIHAVEPDGTPRMNQYDRAYLIDMIRQTEG